MTMTTLLRILLLVFLLIPATAQAQGDDLYKPKDDLYRQNDLPMPDPGDKGQTLGDIFPPEETEPEPAPEVTSVDLANAYFVNCKKEEQNYLRPKTREYLCGCSAAKMAQHLKVDEISALDIEGKKGDDARAKFIINAYAPCIYKPMRDTSKRRCLASNQVRKLLTGKWQICNCTADYMEEYARTAVHVIITKALMEEPMSLDPLERYIDSDSFYAQMRSFMRHCTNEYSYGN